MFQEVPLCSLLYRRTAILSNTVHQCVEGLQSMQVKHIYWYIFEDCDLREMDLSERELNGACFIKVDARGALFIKAQLRDANFEGADLRGTVFTRADLRGALLKGSITDVRTTWDDALMGSSVREVERTTDGLQQIDVLEFVAFESAEA